MKLIELLDKLLDIHEEIGNVEVRYWDESGDHPIDRVKVIEPKAAKGKEPEQPRVVVE